MDTAEAFEWSLSDMAEYYRNHNVFGETTSARTDPVTVVVEGGTLSLGITKEQLETIVSGTSIKNENVRERLASQLQEISSSSSVSVGGSEVPNVWGMLGTARSIFMFLWLLQTFWLLLKGMWTKVSFAQHLVTAIICVAILSGPGYSMITGSILGFSEGISSNLGEAEDTARAIAAAAAITMEAENLNYAQGQQASGTRVSAGSSASDGGSTGDRAHATLGNDVMRVIWQISAFIVKIIGFVLLGGRQLVLAIILLLGPLFFCFSVFEPVKNWGTAWIAALFSVAMWKPFYMALMFLSSNIYVAGVANVINNHETNIFGMIGWNFLIIIISISVPMLTHCVIKGFGGFAIGAGFGLARGATRSAGRQVQNIYRGGSNISAALRNDGGGAPQNGNFSSGGINRNTHI